MKWFFALNENGSQFENYAKMLKVAVHTAQKFTSLQPHFLYDGQENHLTDWLRKRTVTIINCRTFLYEKLRELAERDNNSDYLAIGAGAFLRTEIPRLTLERNFTDEYVLYTDLDIMFLTEVVDFLEKIKPRYFAVAPEAYLSDSNPKDSISNYNKMNSGVMLMNLKNLQANDEKFKNFMMREISNREISNLVKDAWDQTAYKKFYKKRFFGYKWDKLPPEYNWKPYWGDYSNAKIIHFHGPKPFHKEMLSVKNVSEPAKPLLSWVTKQYFELVETWEKYYSETEISE
jgi:hypothetical protein